MIQKCILKENKNPGPIIYTAGGQHMTTKYSTFSTWFADVKLICTCSKVAQITLSQKCHLVNIKCVAARKRISDEIPMIINVFLSLSFASDFEE
jgi:hypothetical protein